MVDIRPVTPDQRDDWQSLFRGYVEFYNAPETPENFDAVWRWIHDPIEPLQSVIAWQDGKALGLAQFWLMPRPSWGQKTCYLSDLFTTPETRGQGLGRALIDYVRDWSAGQGAGDLRWLTAEDNTDARKLYDSYAPKTPFVLYSIPAVTR